MKQSLLLTLALFLSLTGLLKAQEPAITMTTAKDIGSLCRIVLNANADNTKIQVDFGDGKLNTRTIGEASTTLYITVGETQTITIYGDGITQLRCDNRSITSLDVSNCTTLKSLICFDNQLSSLDISKNTALEGLYCRNNQISSLIVSNNPALTDLSCSNNNLTFATLPIKQSTWSDYSYTGQKRVTIPETITTKNTVDLSSQYNISDNITSYVWKKESGDALIENTDYTIKNGVTTFMKSQTEKVYCEMANATFPKFTGTRKLKTSLVTIMEAEKPAITMTTAMDINSDFSFGLKANTDNTKIQVDFGDGQKVEKTIGTNNSTISGTLATSQTVKVYGEDITYFVCINKQLTKLDVSNNPKLTFLNCNCNQLTKLDLSKNAFLTTLKCNENDLTMLNVSNCKELTELYCGSNQLAKLDVSNCKELTKLNCNHNYLTSLDVKNNTALTFLNCYANQLTSLDLTYNTRLDVPCCENNKLTFATLPLPSPKWPYYSYAPQANITIPEIITTNNTVDLSSQYNISDNITSYVWKKESGDALIENTDYTIKNGVTTFMKSQTEKVYCEMTNASFPNFTGTKKLKTSLVTIMEAEKPAITMTTAMAINSDFSFTLKANANNTKIQVDFGDGNKVEKTIGIFSSTISGTLATSQTVRIYGEGITYFSCYDKQLTALDVSNSTKLTTLSCNKNQLTKLDVSKNTKLTKLYCNTNQLTTLNLSNNTLLTNLQCNENDLNMLNVSNCKELIILFCDSNQLSTLNVSISTKLTCLHCNNNQLVSLNISNNTLLKELNCSWNSLSTLNISTCTKLTTFYCSENQLATLDVSNNKELLNFHCSSNKLTTLNVSNNKMLKNFICSSNNLTTLDVSENKALNLLYCSDNKLTFATLPHIQSTCDMYSYHPQQEMTIPETITTSNTVDLSSQYNISDNITTYLWKKESGDALIENTDYTIKNGVTTFLKSQTEPVYCAMTNKTFNSLNERNPLKTTLINVTVSTAIEKETAQQVKIYSNNKTLYVNLENDGQLSVYDISGRMIKSAPVYRGSNIIELTKEGIYVVRVLINGQIITEKVMVK
ncbi:T9SS C-terminal target domain-containing protein [Marinilabiliaceae bacterium JC017]|nr:T9SS C-terminal target domain-containing protein [Marinilabiliaceae bacterium JC017]